MLLSMLVTGVLFLVPSYTLELHALILKPPVLMCSFTRKEYYLFIALGIYVLITMETASNS